MSDSNEAVVEGKDAVSEKCKGKECKFRKAVEKGAGVVLEEGSVKKVMDNVGAHGHFE